MTQEREIQVAGKACRVVLSDDADVLRAARAAGGIAVALLHDGRCRDLSAARYAVESAEDADEGYLERVARREMGLPWNIAETDRLFIREFTMDDSGAVLREAGDGAADKVFYTPSLLEAYIREQYRFFECGIWAVIRKADGVLVGKAGVTFADGRAAAAGGLEPGCELELGYHIFEPYRRRGYAREACRAILKYTEAMYGYPVRAVVKPANQPSVDLLQQLGFRRTQSDAVWIWQSAERG